MKSVRVALVALALPAAVALLPAKAMAFGIGVEGGGTFTQSSGLGANANSVWIANGGIIIENNFPIAILFLDLWADVQTPIALQTGFSLSTGGGATAKYVPIDLGLRLGLNIGLLQPYVGVLGQAGILTESGGTPNMNSPLWWLGGDIGLDLAFFIFRVGIELRALETISSIVSNPPVVAGVEGTNDGSAFQFEALASLRLSF